MLKQIAISCMASLMMLTATAKNNPTLPPGFPDRSPNLDVLPGFKTPPKGYGEVPFYWWIGDTLTKERITAQLDQLKNKNITGLQINYCHTDKGGATYGLTYPSQPALFSDKWWELFRWFLGEAKKRDMSVSLSDYTLGAAGQGWFVDEMLKENPTLNGAKLQLKTYDANGNESLKIQLPQDVISAKAYRVTDGKTEVGTAVDLTSMVQNGELQWKSPAGKWQISVVYKLVVKSSFDPMNPLSGQKTIEKFYQRFEDQCPGEGGKGLNFFFSDELQFGIRGFLWNDRFAGEFMKRKGYDITKKLDHLFTTLSPESYKIRLDYNDVMVSLTEDGFFKPIYEWHNSRGMLFGCDHGGRGRDVTEFGDYFRTQRWLSGPGNDQPYLQKDVTKNKVASSIAHMYERPRTWLEGFYGTGWGTSSSEVADVLFANFAMGHNLLSLHGLYYSTHGSRWEWAAPENHFRQPYWPNMGEFLKCSERLSYILSQGYHRCDVAMIYPVAPVEANLRGRESTQTAFDITRDIYPKGIDFDFMDFESLTRSTIKDKALHVSGEQFKVLILPALSAVRYSTIEKALAFYRAGGIVLAVGNLPEASDRIGADDPQLQAMVREMFGITFTQIKDTASIRPQHNKAGGTGLFIPRVSEVESAIVRLIQPDFRVNGVNLPSNIQHRKLGNRDLYFVYDLPKGTKCTFRCTGKVELWSPWDGSVKPLAVDEVTKTTTTISLPLEKNEAQLIVFSPGKAEIKNTSADAPKTETIVPDNRWEFELKPTLDNQYGDYRQPAFDGKIGAEVSAMKFAFQSEATANCQSAAFDDSNWDTATVAYGAQFLKLGPLPETTDFNALEQKLAKLTQVNANQAIEIEGKSYRWQPYEFSWRWGLKEDAGHQGYHGMKAVINNELISFGIIDKKLRHKPLYPLSKEAGGSVYYLWSTVASSGQVQANIRKDGLLPEKVFVNQTALAADAQSVALKAGNNALLLKYNNVGRGYFVFEQPNTATPKKSLSLATDWYLNPAVLPFNCFPDKKGIFGWYRFMSAPGTRTLYIASQAKPAVWVSGLELNSIPAPAQSSRMADKAQRVWAVNFPDHIKASAQVAVRIEQLPGLFGGAAIPEPVSFECGKGEIALGDLVNNPSLSTYSGGMWYRKTISVNAQQAKASQITLNLGDVVASANVYVNGALVDEKAVSPWTFDLTGRLKDGDNRIEILVYNTLGNHFSTTPSQYVGRTRSGLIGPVELKFTTK